jgi:tetratricopeptide (TPR) repeat protein
MRNLVSWKTGVVAGIPLMVVGLALLPAMAAAEQAAQSQPPAQQKPAPAAGQAQGQAPAQNPGLDQAPVSKEEDDAYRAFFALTPAQGPQIISQGEDFLAKFPSSRYRTSVYSRLVGAYLNSGQKDKMVEVSRKAIAENPDNVDVLALASTVIPRTVTDPKALDADQKLSEAERYAKRAIQLVSSMPKPEGVTDEQFAAAKNEKLGLAHYGLGLVYYMRGNPTAYVPELEQASKLDPQPEPLLFYLLGRGDLRLKNYADATAAFDRCAKAQWDPQWQARCKSGEEEAKQGAAAPAKP